MMQIRRFCLSQIPSPLNKNQHSECGFLFDGRPKEKKRYPHQKERARIRMGHIEIITALLLLWMLPEGLLPFYAWLNAALLAGDMGLHFHPAGTVSHSAN
jgi:hypothetical protein